MYNKETKKRTGSSTKRLPPEYGRLTAFINNDGERTELDLVDCLSVLTEKEISNSELYFKDGVPNGQFSCVDPKTMHLSAYYDELGSGKQSIEIRF